MQKEYRKDLEEGVRGKGLTALEETPDMLRAKNATQILNEVCQKLSGKYLNGCNSLQLINACGCMTLVWTLSLCSGRRAVPFLNTLCVMGESEPPAVLLNSFPCPRLMPSWQLQDRWPRQSSSLWWKEVASRQSECKPNSYFIEVVDWYNKYFIFNKFTLWDYWWEKEEWP